MKTINKKEIGNFKLSTYYKIKDTEFYNNHNMIIVRVVLIINPQMFEVINKLISK